MEIAKDKVKEIVFSKYDYYLKLASEHYSYVKKMGLYPDELVNEALIGIVDCKMKFESEKDIDTFMRNAISSVAYLENKEVGKKDAALPNDAQEYIDDIQEVNSDKPFDYNDSIYAEKSSAIYDLFYEFRFPSGVECPNCGYNGRMTPHFLGWQCLMCKTAISLRSRTYLHKKRYSNAELYRALEVIHRKKNVSASSLSRDANLGIDMSKSILSLQRKVYMKIKTTEVIPTIKKMMTPINFDEDKVLVPDYSYKYIPFSKYPNIREEYIKGATITELQKKYGKNKQSVQEILRGRHSQRYESGHLIQECVEKMKYEKKLKLSTTDKKLTVGIFFKNALKKIRVLEKNIGGIDFVDISN